MVSVREFITKHRSFTSIWRFEFVTLLLVVNAISCSNLVAQVDFETPVVQQHLLLQPGQTIDFRNLPEDVLNCDECRRRLGLQPLSKPIVESKAEKIKPMEARSAVNTMKVEPKSLPTSPPVTVELRSTGSDEKKTEPKSDKLKSDEVASATPNVEKQKVCQLQERDAHLKQFSEMQSNFEERIDQLVRMNEELAKKDAGRQAELDRVQKSSDQALQARELELSNLRADLASVRADAIESSKRLNDQLIEVESKKSKELAKSNSELLEAKQTRIDAVANLHKEFAISRESTANEIAQTNAEQAKTLESHRATIRKLEEQLANAEKVQREDAERLGKLREELNAAFAERTKALNELAKRSKQDESPKTKLTESTKAARTASQGKADEPAKAPSTTKSIDPAKNTVVEPATAKPEQKPAPVENEAPKRRAF